MTVISSLRRLASVFAGTGASFLFHPDPVRVSQLLQGRLRVPVLYDVGIEQLRIVPRHLQRRMPEDLLKPQRISLALDQVHPGERVPELMDPGPVNASAAIVPVDRCPEPVNGQGRSQLRRE